MKLKNVVNVKLFFVVLVYKNLIMPKNSVLLKVVNNLSTLKFIDFLKIF